MPQPVQLSSSFPRSSWLRGPVSYAGGGRRFLSPVKSVVVAAVLALGSIGVSEAGGQTGKESDLQAVLLYNFMQFVEWPPQAFQAADTPFVIGILGHDPFGRVLDDLVRRETHDRRRIVVERYRSVTAIGRCQILFVAASESRDLPRILSAVRGRPLLTVAEFENFAGRGGMIRFQKTADNKITLQINLAAARASGLAISARLLRVAEVVSPPPVD